MLKVLRSGTVVWVDPETRVAEIQRCGWLIQVASGNPEPDSEADLWVVQECGQKVRTLDGTLDHTTCSWGHDRHAYGSAEWHEDQMEFEARQRREGVG